MSLETQTVWGLGAVAGNTFARVVKKVDETRNNDDTFSDDAELFVALSANKTYGFFMAVMLNSVPPANFRFTWSVPSGAFFDRSQTGPWSTGIPVLLSGSGSITNITAGDKVFPVMGRIVTGGTAGNFSFQWGQGTSDPANTTMLQGTYLVVWEE